VAERASAQDDQYAPPRHARPARRTPQREAPAAGNDARHPGRTPALLTLAVTVVLVGAGWLTQGRDDTPTRLAVPMGNGSDSDDDDGARNGEVGVSESAPGTPLGVSRDGEPAYVLANWLDVPLVAPAAAIQPDALGTLIPIVPFTGIPTPGGDDGSPTGGSGTDSGSGDTPSDEDDTTSTTARTGTDTGGPGSTASSTTTPTTTPDDTTPPATDPPDTTPPATDPPDTTPPTTAPPDTTPPPTEPPPTEGDGLLGVVDDLLTGTVTPLLGI
jgi:hypothetical protein